MPTNDRVLQEKIDLLYNVLEPLSNAEAVNVIGYCLLQLGLSQIQSEQEVHLSQIPKIIRNHQKANGETLQAAMAYQGWTMVMWGELKPKE